MSHDQALECLREGVRAAKAGEKERARRLFRHVVQHDPASDAAHLWLASLADSPLEALEHLEHVLAQNPSHEKALVAARAARVRAGVEAAKHKDMLLARRLLRQAVAEDPGCEKAWVWLAGVAESPVETIDALERALALNPSNEKARTALEHYRAQYGAEEAKADDTVAPSAQLEDARRRVLLADNSAMVRKLVAFALGSHGYMVHTAANGTEVIKSLHDQGIPDALVLEANLAETDGYQLCKLLRQEPATTDVPIILLTEQNGLLKGMRGHMAGANEMFVKSLELGGLLDLVDGLVLAR